jgi:hypothetical protein
MAPVSQASINLSSALETTMNKLVGNTLISVCIAAATASVAIAQPAQRGDWRPGAAQRGEYTQRAFARPTERVEARLAYIKTALKISPMQEPQWQAYADVVRRHAQDAEQRLLARRADKAARAPGQRPNAIERLERVQSFHAATVTRINALLAVEKPLYAALSPDQQKVADVVLNRRSGFQRGARHLRGGEIGRG